MPLLKKSPVHLATCRANGRSTELLLQVQDSLAYHSPGRNRDSGPAHVQAVCKKPELRPCTHHEGDHYWEPIGDLIGGFN